MFRFSQFGICSDREQADALWFEYYYILIFMSGVNTMWRKAGSVTVLGSFTVFYIDEKFCYYKLQNSANLRNSYACMQWSSYIHKSKTDKSQG